MPKRTNTDLLFLAAVMLAALALRLDFLVSNSFVIDADEAIVGLMARHINLGQAIPVFYYGQHYMGSFEPLVAALFFRLFGESSLVLKTVPLFFSLILIGVVYALTLELGSRTAARAAAILAAIPPSALVIWSAMARGGFIEIVLIGALSFWAGSRWLKQGQPGLGLTVLVGLLIGFGWWVNNQIVYFAMPLAFFMFGHWLWSGGSLRWKESGFGAWSGRAAGYLCCGLAGFFAGGLPFWIYNIEHKFVSFEMFQHAHKKDLLKHVTGTFDTALPILLGARRFWADQELFPSSTWLMWCFYGALLAYLIWERRGQVAALFCFRVDAKRPVELYIIFIIGALAVFILSSFGFLVQAPRYLLPLYVAVFVLLGVAFEIIWGRWRVLALLLLSVALVFNLCSSYLDGRAIPGEPFVFKGERASKDQRELIGWLDENDIRWVRTNYWIGYRLAFETGERVRFLVNQEPYATRIDSYQEEGLKLPSDSMPLVLVPAQGKIIKEALEILGYSYREEYLSGYVVLYQITPKQTGLKPISTQLMTVRASGHNQDAQNAIDGDVQTRWGCGEPQKPGMWFEVELNPVQELRAIEYDLANWAHDYPRGFTVDLELESGEVRRLFSPDSWASIRYFLQAQSKVTFFFEPLRVKKVILRQLGSHPIFDWSIAELRLWD
jgi:hypothetical protein